MRPPLFDRLPPDRQLLLTQFSQFAMIGLLGFVWDTTTVYALTPSIGPYFAGAIAYLVAASSSWMMNRLWTYRHLTHAAMHRQWMAFLLSNLVGFTLNRGTYFTLIATLPLFRHHLILAVAGGAAAGMFVNFTLSRRLVFR